jgi:hypothetical protein
MALQASGQITIVDIVGEFGGTAPHALNEYYGVATGVPTSGQIALSNFYGKSAAAPLYYSGGVSEITAGDNASTTVSSTTHIVMGLRGRSNGYQNGGYDDTAGKVDNRHFLVLRSQQVNGNSGALTRGTITESGPTHIGTACSNQIGTITAPANKFMVGLRLNNTKNGADCDWVRFHAFDMYLRYASMGSAVTTGSVTNTSMPQSAREAYGSNVNSATNRFTTGYRIGTGGGGEYTDNFRWVWFYYGLVGQTAEG